MDGSEPTTPTRRLQASESADGSVIFLQPHHQVVGGISQMALREHRRSAPSAAIREDIVRLPPASVPSSTQSQQHSLSTASTGTSPASAACSTTGTTFRYHQLSATAVSNRNTGEDAALIRSGSTSILTNSSSHTALPHASGSVSSVNDVSVVRRSMPPQLPLSTAVTPSNVSAAAAPLTPNKNNDADINSNVVQCVPPVINANGSALALSNNAVRSLSRSTRNLLNAGNNLAVAPQKALGGVSLSLAPSSPASSSSTAAASLTSGTSSTASVSTLPVVVSSQQHSNQSQQGVLGLDFTPAPKNSHATASGIGSSRISTTATNSDNALPSLNNNGPSNPLYAGSSGTVNGGGNGVRLAFSSDKHARLCLEMFNQFRQSEDLIDVHVVVDELRIPCHKIVLSASSPYFRAMFTSGYYDESKQTTRQVVIHDVDAFASELLISYMYTGKIVIDEDNVQLLLPVARLFHLNEVVEKCCEFLREQLDPHNCLGIRNFADTYSCAELKEHADKYATQNFLDVVRNDEFLMLTTQQLKEIVKSEELNCPNEEDVFNAVTRWFAHDAKERQPFLYEVMQHVRFALLEPKFLIGIVCTNSMLKSCTRCRDLIDEAKDYHLLPATRAQQQGERFRLRRGPARDVLFAVGGWCSGDAIHTVERYDSQQNEWRCVQQMSERRCGVGVAVLDGTIYAVGGHNGQQYLNSVERYVATSNVWHSDVTNTKCCRTSVGVAVMDGYLYAVGGQDGVSCLNIVERYDPKTNRWTQVQAMNEKRLGVAVGVLNGCLYACGGSNGEFPLSSVEKYDPKSDKWTSCASMRTKRKHLGCAVVDGFLYAAGGRDDSSELASCERYDPRRNAWEPIASMNSHRSGVGLAVVNGMLYACGGFDGQEYLKSCECYDAGEDAWRDVANMNFRRLGGGVAVLKVRQTVADGAAGTNAVGLGGVGQVVSGGVGGIDRSPTWNPLG